MPVGLRLGAIDAAALGPFEKYIVGPRPRTRKRKVFSLLIVIFVVGTISIYH